MSQEAVGLIEKSRKALRQILGLDSEFKSSAVYDMYTDTIVVKVVKNYKTPLQCPGKTYIILFEEECRNPIDSGNRDIAGFQIDDVKNLCRQYDIHPIENTLRVSEILKAMQKEDVSSCIEVAIDTALELLRKHDLDEIQFS